VPTLRDLGEIEVLRRLTADRSPAAGVALGPGDDAAVLDPSPGTELVATTDAFVEGAHYLPAWSAPERTGARLATANLSDLAAMAATPRWALLSIGARPESEVDALLALQRGAEDRLARFGAVVVGGNLTSVSGAEWASLTLLGEVPAGRYWTRSGARPGDLLAITGSPGRAGAGLALARRLEAGARSPEWQALLDAWLEPEPRLDLALDLASTGAVKAAMDVSDGVAQDLARLCEASGVGAEIATGEWPDDSELARASHSLGVPLEALRLGPSDDYELVLAVDPKRRAACEDVAARHGVALGFVGRFIEESGLSVRLAGGEVRALRPKGYDAFEGEG